jgi:hypothetical protein
MASKREGSGDTTTEVRAFLDGLKHGRKEDVLAVRDIVLSAHPAITERISGTRPASASMTMTASPSGYSPAIACSSSSIEGPRSETM